MKRLFALLWLGLAGIILASSTAPGQMPGTFTSLLSSQQVYQISRSLRFNSADSPMAYRTFSSNSTSNTKGILSIHLKRGSLATRTIFFYLGTNNVGANNFILGEFLADNTLAITFNGSATLRGTSTGLFRDPSASMHVVVSLDISLASNSVLAWVNGEPVTFTGTFATSTTFQGGAGNILAFGDVNTGGAVLPYDGLIADPHWIDGQHDTSAHLLFGRFSPSTGAWEPIEYTGAYPFGTNGGHWDFSDNSNTTSSTLGKDRSGNNNDLTMRNFSVAAGPGNDSLTDTPNNYGTDTGLGGEVRGNFATMSPIHYNGLTLSNGNLQVTSTANNMSSRTAFGMKTGKWVAELERADTSASGVQSWFFGVVPTGTPPDSTAYNTTGSYLYYSNTGAKYVSGSSSAFGSVWTTAGDKVRLEFDADAGTMECFLNGISQGTITGIPAGTYEFMVARTGGTSATSVHLNFGQRPFSNTASAGFKALCTQNIPNSVAITTSGTFTGNAAADGPFVQLNGAPTAMTINGNAVTFGTHADKTANGFKLRSSSSSYNTAGSNTYSVTATGAKFKYGRAQANP